MLPKLCKIMKGACTLFGKPQDLSAFHLWLPTHYTPTFHVNICFEKSSEKKQRRLNRYCSRSISSREPREMTPK